MSPMKAKDVVALVTDQLWPAFDAERRRLLAIDRWYRWDHPHDHIPHNASHEHRRLAELSRTPWLGLVVNVVSQSMLADGYKSPDARADSSAWRTWKGNGFDARQVAIHKAALAYGYSFASVLPGSAPDGSAMAAMRGVSPLSMQAFYTDPAEDDWPMFALRVYGDQPGNTQRIRVYDDNFVYMLSSTNDSVDGLRFIEYREHGVGVTPIVRYANQLDLDGRTPGEVEPFIPIAARINKTDYDRMLTQHFASWMVKYIAGLEAPDDATEARLQKLRLRQDDLLVAEDADTKFGVLPASPLDGFISAHDTDVHTLAAVSQTPTHALTGDLVNLSADALASARAQLDQKVTERKTAFGQSHAQALRLAARIEGNPDAANDVMSRITWQDMSIRSMAQAVDALGKAATMLSVPVEALWPMIPGVSKPDVDDWKVLARRAAARQTVNVLANAAAANGRTTAPPSGIAA